MAARAMRAGAAVLLLGSTLAWAQVPAAAPEGAASSPTPTPTATAPAGMAAAASAPAVQPTAAQGRKAYTSYCTRCHGINLVVGSSAFYDLRTFPQHDKARFVRSVTQGVRAMPAWGGIVKAEDIESIWLFIGSVNGWPAP